MNTISRRTQTRSITVLLLAATLLASGSADAAPRAGNPGGRRGGLSAWGGGRMSTSFRTAASPPYRPRRATSGSARRQSASAKPQRPSGAFNQRAGSARSPTAAKPAVRVKSPTSSKPAFNRAARPRPLRTISKGDLTRTFNRAAKPAKRRESPALRHNPPAPRF